jgi:hypothetical protein
MRCTACTEPQCLYRGDLYSNASEINRKKSFIVTHSTVNLENFKDIETTQLSPGNKFCQDIY